MTRSALAELVCPDGLRPLRLVVREELGTSVTEGELISENGSYPIHDGIPSFAGSELDGDQTVQSFAQKWMAHRYYREHTGAFYTTWYLQRYGFGTLDGLREAMASCRFVLDAGTGSGRDALTFADQSTAVVYAVDTAHDALVMAQRDLRNPRIAFVHADVRHLPFRDNFFDFINCDQVIHHTPVPRETFDHLRRKLKRGGQLCCYVYRRKGAIREFTDDFVRERIADLPIDQALQVCEGITRLGQTLAHLRQEVQIEEDIPILGIKKGRIDLQRFVHWNVLKCFWNDDFDFFTNNIINFDWYHPRHCFRFEPDAFRAWFADGWEILAWDVQDAGISCRARKL